MFQHFVVFFSIIVLFTVGNLNFNTKTDIIDVLKLIYQSTRVWQPSNLIWILRKLILHVQCNKNKTIKDTFGRHWGILFVQIYICWVISFSCWIRINFLKSSTFSQFLNDYFWDIKGMSNVKWFFASIKILLTRYLDELSSFKAEQCLLKCF